MCNSYVVYYSKSITKMSLKIYAKDYNLLISL
jgi:hypothetical protein